MNVIIRIFVLSVVAFLEGAGVLGFYNDVGYAQQQSFGQYPTSVDPYSQGQSSYPVAQPNSNLAVAGKL